MQHPRHMMNCHLNVRMSSEDKRIIETAARLKGFKPNTYARMRLVEIAEKDIAEVTRPNTLSLSQKDWEQFVAIMEAPMEENKNLKIAVTDFYELIGS